MSRPAWVGPRINAISDNLFILCSDRRSISAPICALFVLGSIVAYDWECRRVAVRYLAAFRRD